MRGYLNLFGRSPIAPIQSHMDQVARCVHMLLELFAALAENDYSKVDTLAQKISEGEHQADIIKNDIRNHLPKSLFLSIDRNNLLDILSMQDSIADIAEDIAVLVTLKPIVILQNFSEELMTFTHKNIEAFDEAHKIIIELNELSESSFGGLEAEKVRVLVDLVAFKEHEVDLMQRKLLTKLLALENEITFATFYLWQKIFQSLAAISDLSEKLANRVRMILEVQ